MTAYKVIDNADGTHQFIELTPEEEAESLRQAEIDMLSRVAEKGHSCWEHVEHRLDPVSPLGDYYTCKLCGDLLQVG